MLQRCTVVIRLSYILKIWEEEVLSSMDEHHIENSLSSLNFAFNIVT
jgi:hypothetical protein